MAARGTSAAFPLSQSGFSMRSLLRLSVVSLAVAWLAACGNSKSTAPPATMPEVGVVKLEPRRVVLGAELPGRTSAWRVAEVRPQVGGIIQKRLFTEGSEVQAGQQLYQIDAAPLRAAESAARARVARAEAQVASTQALARRYEPLRESGVVSQQAYEDAVAAANAADAELRGARAELEAATINLTYTRVLSPIAGRIGRSLVTEGALVKAEQDQPLATIQQLDPIYVDVTQSSAELLRLRRDMADAGKAGDELARVELTLEDGSRYPEAGTLQFAEVSVDPGTGAVLLRAVVPNPRRELLPGMFVRARINLGVRERALLVPQPAVSRNGRGEPTVLVVDDQDMLVERVIRTDRVVDNAWLVEEGLSAGDRVVVEGVQKVRPGVQVKVVEAGTLARAPAVPATTTAER